MNPAWPEGPSPCEGGEARVSAKQLFAQTVTVSVQTTPAGPTVRAKFSGFSIEMPIEFVTPLT
jgi:hypothetical protein